MEAQEQVEFMMDKRDKASFERLCQSLDLTPGKALKIFIENMLETGTMPVSALEPSDRLLKAMESKERVSFSDPEEALRYLYDGLEV